MPKILAVCQPTAGVLRKVWLFLASSVSDYSNGNTVAVDGGWLTR